VPGSNVSCLAIAERICTPREWALFQALPAERVQDAFFACWTRKEAIAKALAAAWPAACKPGVCFPDGGLPDGRVRLRDAGGREWGC